MTNCRHLILFLVVQKILAWLKWTTVFTVTTECISQNGSEKKFELQQDINIIAHSQNQTSLFFSEGTETVSFYLIGHATTKKVSHRVDETKCRWAKCAPSEGNSVGASGAPLRALSSDFVVLSSASERPETELFQSRCSLGGFVTEDSSVKTKRDKLSVEMTDQPFVTKWTICLQTRYSFLPVRRPPWLHKHSFSTAQVRVMLGSPSSALSIPEEEEEELFSAMSIAFAWLQKLPSNRVAPP